MNMIFTRKEILMGSTALRNWPWHCPLVILERINPRRY
jgi:hypothetical protein